MMVRRIALLVGLVALLVGVVGLFVPVSVSPGLTTVACGTPVAPDLAGARVQAPADTQTSPAELPYGAEWVGDVDYVEICRQDLADRRAWTISLAAAGALVLGATGALYIRARRADATQS